MPHNVVDRSAPKLSISYAFNFLCVKHVQLADNPGRHEPGTGEIAWDHVFAHIDRVGYTGWVGCEYIPATTTEAGLGWMERYAPLPEGSSARG